MGGSRARRVETTTGRTTSSLPAGQQQNVDLLMSGARDWYNTGGPQFYPGQTYAGPTENELAARQGMLGYAGGVGQQFVDQARAGEQFWLNPENIFRPENIPGFRASQQNVTDLITRNLTENVLPNIRGGSVAQGVLGGSRQEIGEGLATEGTSRAIGDTLSGMELGAYGQGLEMYSAAAGRAPQTYALGLAPSGVREYVGGQERADTQQGIDEQLARFNFEQLAPLLNLEAFKELTGTMGQYGGQIDTTGRSEIRARQGGDTGSQVMQAIGTMISLFAASHSSLKKDIVAVEGVLGKLQKLGIYRWTYKEEATPHIGPMAEEFQQAFGVGDGQSLYIFDVLGVLLGAIKELSLRTEGA